MTLLFFAWREFLESTIRFLSVFQGDGETLCAVKSGIFTVESINLTRLGFMLCAETNVSGFAVMCWTPTHQEGVGRPFKGFHLAAWRERALVLKHWERKSTCWVAVVGRKMPPMKYTAMMLWWTSGVMLLHCQLQGNTPHFSTKLIARC